jgi:hypothetical protein
MWWNTLDPADIAIQSAKGIQIFMMGVDTIFLNRELRRLVNESRQGWKKKSR